MVMANDAQKRSRENAGVGWGGSRQKKWNVQGKRAVVHVEPGAYEFLTQLARLCNRGQMEMCAHVFVAGLESLTGFTATELAQEEFALQKIRASVRPKGLADRPLTHDEVRAVAAMFSIVPREEDELEYDPEFDD